MASLRSAAAPRTAVRNASALAKARVSRRPLTCRADGGFIGSPTNLIVVASTTLALASGRFGLAPTVKQGTTAGLKLVDRPVGVLTNDPAGFTVVDVLAHGAVGHVLGVGIVLGLKGVGAL